MWSTWALRLGGLLILDLVVVVVLSGIFSGIALPGGPDYSRDEVAETLADVNDNEAAYILAIAFDVAANLETIAVAAILYLLVRSGPWYALSRETDPTATDPGRLAACPRLIALMATLGLTAGATMFLVGDLADIALYRLAVDLNEGGVEGTDEADILQSARVVGLISEAADITGFTALGAGLLLFGGLIALYPLAHTVPAAAYRTIPRWLGWPAMAGGALMLLGWLSYVEEDLIIVLFAGVVVALAWLLALGVWFLLYAGREVSSDDARAAS
jgi:hypothetical protein